MNNQQKTYDPRCSLSFGVNKRKEKPGHPDFSGTLTDENGQEYWLSIWPKTNRTTGEEFWTGSFRKKEPRQSSAGGPPRAGSLSMRRRTVDDDSDVP